MGVKMILNRFMNINYEETVNYLLINLETL